MWLLPTSARLKVLKNVNCLIFLYCVKFVSHCTLFPISWEGLHTVRQLGKNHQQQASQLLFLGSYTPPLKKIIQPDIKRKKYF